MGFLARGDPWVYRHASDASLYFARREFVVEFADKHLLPKGKDDRTRPSGGYATSEEMAQAGLSPV